MWKFVTDVIPKNYSYSKSAIRKIVGSSPLHEAAQTGDIAKMTELLDGGCDIELHDDKGESPIFRAIRGRQPAAVQFCLHTGRMSMFARWGEHSADAHRFIRRQWQWTLA
jgi:ankyrin repeat protein